MTNQSDEQRLREAIRTNTVFERSQNSTGLVVFTHGYKSKPSDYEDLLVDLLTDQDGPLTNCDLLPYHYRAWVGANTKLHGAATRPEKRKKYESVKLNKAIGKLYDARRYQDIYLVGHSLGGILIRATVLEGWEGITGAPTGQHWVSRIRRLVLLAATNRGVVLNRFLHRAGYVFGRACFRGKLIRDALRGSELINNQRLGWIFKFQRSGRTPPEIVQILGDCDDTVSKYDSTDLERFPNSWHVRLNDIGHTDFLGMNRDHDVYPVIRGAFDMPNPRNSDQRSPTLPESDASSLVFLIHGIRDFGEWQSSLARAIRAKDSGAKVVSVRYGYFNIFQFLLGFQRGRAVRSFTDRYIEEIANLSRDINDVRIVVAAHSNGTYVLGNAMKRFPYLVVNRAYLAGSVLPRRFFIRHALSLLQRERLQSIRNDCARWDWPVGILCSALRFAGFFNAIGVAGYLGLKTRDGSPLIHNSTYLNGGHGVAFQPNLHDNIANYLLQGHPSSPGVRKKGSWIMHTLFASAPLLLAAVLYGLFKVYASFIPWLAGIVSVMPPGPFQVTASAVFTVLFILLLVRI